MRRRKELQSLEELNSQAKFLASEARRVQEETHDLEFALQRENNKTLIALEIYDREIQGLQGQLADLRAQHDYEGRLAQRVRLEQAAADRTKELDGMQRQLQKARRRNRKLTGEMQAIEKEFVVESARLRKAEEGLAKASDRLQETVLMLEEGGKDTQNLALMPELNSHYQELSQRHAALQEKIGQHEKDILKTSNALENKLQVLEIEQRKQRRLADTSRRFQELRAEGARITEQQNKIIKQNEIIKRRLEMGELKNFEMIAKLARLDDEIFEKNKEEHQLLEELEEARAILQARRLALDQSDQS